MLVLLNGDLSPILGADTGAAVAAVTETTGEVVGQAAAAPAPQGIGGMFAEMGPFVWIIWGAVIVGFYFLTIRPQRKRDKQMKEMQATMKVGDNVVTSGGWYGKIADVGHDCFIVEFGTNRGVRIPVRKSDVLGIATPQITQTKAD